MTASGVEVLLIGGGVASASAAAELRVCGFAGTVMLATRDLDAPYHRPPVSKGLLTGRDADDSILVHDSSWWNQHDVELLTRASVTALDVTARTATLASKTEIGFERALIATGAMVRRLAVDGAQLEGIHYLRAPGNARALRQELTAAERVVVVGGSFIATEVAASLATIGKRCRVLMQEQRPLERVFGGFVGEYVGALLREHDVELHAGEDVVAFEGDERVTAVRTASGLRLETDLVIVGVGATPDTMLARRAGLELGETGGVRCDRFLRTSADGVYAAGDMCEYDSVVHQRRLRVEHEEHAVAQGQTAARNLLGEQLAHEVVPYFWSEIADWAKLESLGPAHEWDAELVTGSVEDHAFTVWYLRDERIVGSLSVNQPDALAHARPLIAGHAESARLSEWQPYQPPSVTDRLG